MSMTSRDFLRAATRRLSTAQFLLMHGFTLDAMYLAGYCVECSLKALILEKTPQNKRSVVLKSLTSGARMHRAEVLADELKKLGSPVNPQLLKQLIRFGWTTSLRYESGRKNTGEAKGFLKKAEEVYNWVKGELP
jgi:HEPN domain-containing protein